MKVMATKACRVGIALFMMLATSNLNVATTYATTEESAVNSESAAAVSTVSCPSESQLLASFTVKGDTYAATTGSTEVTIKGTRKNGTFEATKPVSAVVVKGKTQHVNYPLSPVSQKGSFSNVDLPGGGAHGANITEVLFCSPTADVVEQPVTPVPTPTPSPIAATNEECVDGWKHDNIGFDWTESIDTITVFTLDGKPVCEDVTFFFSSYVMPDTWDGEGWNETASPQQLFASVSATFESDTPAPTATLTVQLPEECKDAQLDLYFAPEVQTVIYPVGHGEQNIISDFRYAESECEEQQKEMPTETEAPVAPQAPELPQQPVILPIEAPAPVVTPANEGQVLSETVTAKPVIETAPAPAATEVTALPNTGAEAHLSMLLATMAGSLAYVSTLLTQKRRIDITTK